MFWILSAHLQPLHDLGGRGIDEHDLILFLDRGGQQPAIGRQVDASGGAAERCPPEQGAVGGVEDAHPISYSARPGSLSTLPNGLAHGDASAVGTEALVPKFRPLPEGNRRGDRSCAEHAVDPEIAASPVS